MNGTTQEIVAGGTSSNFPTLAGRGTNISGLYALAPITDSGDNGGNVFYRSHAHGGSGGGLSDMIIEAMGLTAGPAMEIDAGSGPTFSNLDVRDAIGTGNSVFQCGNPAALTDDSINIQGWFRSIRAETRSPPAATGRHPAQSSIVR